MFQLEGPSRSKVLRVYASLLSEARFLLPYHTTGLLLGFRRRKRWRRVGNLLRTGLLSLIMWVLENSSEHCERMRVKKGKSYHLRMAG